LLTSNKLDEKIIALKEEMFSCMGLWVDKEVCVMGDGNNSYTIATTEQILTLIKISSSLKEEIDSNKFLKIRKENIKNLSLLLKKMIELLNQFYYRKEDLPTDSLPSLKSTIVFLLEQNKSKERSAEAAITKIKKKFDSLLAGIINSDMNNVIEGLKEKKAREELKEKKRNKKTNYIFDQEILNKYFDFLGEQKPSISFSEAWKLNIVSVSPFDKLVVSGLASSSIVSYLFCVGLIVFSAKTFGVGLLAVCAIWMVYKFIRYPLKKKLAGAVNYLFSKELDWGSTPRLRRRRQELENYHNEESKLNFLNTIGSIAGKEVKILEEENEKLRKNFLSVNDKKGHYVMATSEQLTRFSTQINLLKPSIINEKLISHPNRPVQINLSVILLLFQVIVDLLNKIYTSEKEFKIAAEKLFGTVSNEKKKKVKEEVKEVGLVKELIERLSLLNDCMSNRLNIKNEIRNIEDFLKQIKYPVTKKVESLLNNNNVNYDHLRLPEEEETLSPDGYDLKLMSELPKNNDQKDEKGKIYLSQDGTYVGRNFEGKIFEGKIFNIDWGDLDEEIEKPEFKEKILEATSKAGHTPPDLNKVREGLREKEPSVSFSYAWKANVKNISKLDVLAGTSIAGVAAYILYASLLAVLTIKTCGVGVLVVWGLYKLTKYPVKRWVAKLANKATGREFDWGATPSLKCKRRLIKDQYDKKMKLASTTVKNLELTAESQFLKAENYLLKERLKAENYLLKERRYRRKGPVPPPRRKGKERDIHKQFPPTCPLT